MQIEKRNYVCSFEESFEGRFLERLWCVSGFGRFRASERRAEGGGSLGTRLAGCFVESDFHPPITKHLRHRSPGA